jgi:hypothetical protein
MNERNQNPKKLNSKPRYHSQLKKGYPKPRMIRPAQVQLVMSQPDQENLDYLEAILRDCFYMNLSRSSIMRRALRLYREHLDGILYDAIGGQNPGHDEGIMANILEEERLALYKSNGLNPDRRGFLQLFREDIEKRSREMEEFQAEIQRLIRGMTPEEAKHFIKEKYFVTPIDEKIEGGEPK